MNYIGGAVLLGLAVVLAYFAKGSFQRVAELARDYADNKTKDQGLTTLLLAIVFAIASFGAFIGGLAAFGLVDNL